MSVTHEVIVSERENSCSKRRKKTSALKINVLSSLEAYALKPAFNLLLV